MKVTLLSAVDFSTPEQNCGRALYARQLDMETAPVPSDMLLGYVQDSDFYRQRYGSVSTALLVSIRLLRLHKAPAIRCTLVRLFTLPEAIQQFQPDDEEIAFYFQDWDRIGRHVCTRVCREKPCPGIIALGANFGDM